MGGKYKYLVKMELRMNPVELVFFNANSGGGISEVTLVKVKCLVMHFPFF